MEELTPKQILFLTNYLDPKSKTFSNAYQSAISAGFSEEYAKTIISRGLEWVSENVRRVKMLEKAEQRLEEAISLPIVDIEGKTDKAVIDASKFVASRLGKEKWSERTELTGKDGKDLIVQPINYADTAQIQSENIPTTLSKGDGQGD